MNPTTPTTPKSCCEECGRLTYTPQRKDSLFLALLRGIRSECENAHCPCHSNSTQEYGQPEHKGNGDTIASLEELAKLMQAPQHTSPEKKYVKILPTMMEALKMEVGIDYNKFSHYHCWDQDQPPACGIPPEKHDQCCLCDLRPVSQDKESPEIDPNQMMHDLHEEIEGIQSAPSFTEKTLSEFRERYHRAELKLPITHSPVPFEQWLSTKLSEAQNKGGQRYIEGFENGEEAGRKAERTRILSLIESKKKDESCSSLEDCGYHAKECFDDCWAAINHNAALTALAEELGYEKD